MIRKPCAMKIEIAEDFRVEQRDGVGGDGIAEAGVKFLGDRRAADDARRSSTMTFSPAAAR